MAKPAPQLKKRITVEIIGVKLIKRDYKIGLKKDERKVKYDGK